MRASIQNNFWNNEKIPRNVSQKRSPNSCFSELVRKMVVLKLINGAAKLANLQLKEIYSAMKTTSPFTTRGKGVSNDKWFRQFDVNAVHSSLCNNHSHGNHWNNCYFTNTSVLWVMVVIFKIKSRDSWGIMHLVPSRKRWQLDQEAEDIIFIISAWAGRIACTHWILFA